MVERRFGREKVAAMRSAFRRWLEKLLRGQLPRRTLAVRRVLPGFEQLEDRSLPSGVFPYVQSINRSSPAGPVTNAGSVSYTVTFDEAVTGVAVGDFQVALTSTAAGTLTQVTPVSGSIYTVSIGGVSGNGTLGLNLVDNGSIRDLAGNPLTQPNAPAAFQFQAGQTFSGGFASPTLVTADINGDGITDGLMVNNTFVNAYLGTVTVQLGAANGHILSSQTIAVGPHPYALVVGDVNGDGKPDLLVADTVPQGSLVTLLLGNGNGNSRPSNLSPVLRTCLTWRWEI